MSGPLDSKKVIEAVATYGAALKEFHEQREVMKVNLLAMAGMLVEDMNPDVNLEINVRVNILPGRTNVFVIYLEGKHALCKGTLSGQHSVADYEITHSMAFEQSLRMGLEKELKQFVDQIAHKRGR